MSTSLSDSPSAPKLVPHFDFQPVEIFAALAEMSDSLRQVVIESPDEGGVSHLVGPFANEGEAQIWADAFCAKHEFDKDFVSVQYMWEMTAPDDPELDEFYG